MVWATQLGIQIFVEVRGVCYSGRNDIVGFGDSVLKLHTAFSE